MWLREVGPHILKSFGLICFGFVGLWILGMGANWLFGGFAPKEEIIPLEKQSGSYPISNVNLVKQKEE